MKKSIFSLIPLIFSAIAANGTEPDAAENLFSERPYTCKLTASFDTNTNQILYTTDFASMDASSFEVEESLSSSSFVIPIAHTTRSPLVQVAIDDLGYAYIFYTGRETNGDEYAVAYVSSNRVGSQNWPTFPERPETLSFDSDSPSLIIYLQLQTEEKSSGNPFATATYKFLLDSDEPISYNHDRERMITTDEIVSTPLSSSGFFFIPSLGNGKSRGEPSSSSGIGNFHFTEENKLSIGNGHHGEVI